MNLLLAFLALFLFCYSLVDRRMEKTLVNGAFLFMTVGMGAGPMGLGWVSFPIEAEGMKFLAELTLAVVLFSDAASSRLSILRKTVKLPERLLGIGLPLTILLGWGLARLVFPELGNLERVIS